MNNHRQLCLAWRMYTEDNADKLLYSSGASPAYNPNVPCLVLGHHGLQRGQSFQLGSDV